MDQVLNLSNRLRTNGIDCSIDQYVFSPPEGWPRWMANQIEEADFVLVVCTESYECRFKGKEETGKGLGAKWEGAIITQELFDAEAKNTNFIPVIFSEKESVHIPIVLRSATYYKLNTEEGYEALYRHLTNQPRVSKPELGKLLPMPPLERKQDFFNTLWNVPYPRNPFFTGREEVLEQLRKALATSKTAALSQTQAICGLGGIGKTQTAVEYAYRYRDEYKAVLWTKADSGESLISDFVLISSLLNLPYKDEKDQNLAVAAVKRWLENNNGWLLIFDNADNPSLIEAFIPPNPKGHILLTSRAQVFDNLGITNPLELDKMQPDEAKQFLIKRTGRSNLELKEIEAIEQLAEELDYLPLALEQAGAYITKIKCSFQNYLISYRKRGLELLEQSRVIAGKYPKSVATTWSLNFEQVAQTSSAATDLLYTSAFLNPYAIPIELITAGAGELSSELSSSLANVESNPLVLDEILEQLSQYSLIRRDVDSRTYSIHRMVQAVLRDGMDINSQHIWAEHIVRAVNCAFPKVEFSNWNLCERLLLHAQSCAELIEKMGFEFQEAARLLNQMGEYLCKRARFGEAEPFLTRALAIREKTLGLDHLDVAMSLMNLAELYHEQGKFDKVESLCLRSLAIREKTVGPDDPYVAESLNALALLYLSQGKFDMVEPLLIRALAIWEEASGKEHPDVATCLNNLAMFYNALGEYDKAVPFSMRSLAIREMSPEANHPDVANSLHNLAILYANQGKYYKAEPLLKRSLEIWKKTLGPDHPEVATSLNNLAMLYINWGKYDGVEMLCMQSLAIREKSYGNNHPEIAESLRTLALLFSHQGKYSLSKNLYTQALKIYEKVLGLDHPLVATCLENYASLLRKMKRGFEAARMEVRARAIKSKQTIRDRKEPKRNS